MLMQPRYVCVCLWALLIFKLQALHNSIYMHCMYTRTIQEFKETYHDLTTQLNQLEQPEVSQAITTDMNGLELCEIYNDNTQDIVMDKDIDIDTPSGVHVHTHAHVHTHSSKHDKVRIVKMTYEDNPLASSQLPPFPSVQKETNTINTDEGIAEMNIKLEIKEKEKEIQRLKDRIERNHNYQLKEDEEALIHTYTCADSEATATSLLSPHQSMTAESPHIDDDPRHTSFDHSAVGGQRDDGSSCETACLVKDETENHTPQTPTTPLTRLRREDFSQSIALAMSLLPEGK